MQSIKDCLSVFYSCRDEAVKIIVEISHKFAKKKTFVDFGGVFANMP